LLLHHLCSDRPSAANKPVPAHSLLLSTTGVAVCAHRINNINKRREGLPGLSSRGCSLHTQKKAPPAVHCAAWHSLTHSQHPAAPGQWFGTVPQPATKSDFWKATHSQNTSSHRNMQPAAAWFQQTAAFWEPYRDKPEKLAAQEQLPAYAALKRTEHQRSTGLRVGRGPPTQP
jgi:hypothetical protein